MTNLNKKSPSNELGLNQKQKTASGRKLFSTPTILPETKPVKNSLGKARYSPVCYLCGKSKNLTTYHAAGGVLGVCVSCNGGMV